MAKGLAGWVGLVSALSTLAGSVTAPFAAAPKMSGRIDIGAIVSALSADDVGAKARLAVAATKRVASDKGLDLQAAAFGANGVTTHVWTGSASEANADTWSKELRAVIQIEPCHDLGRSFRTALAAIVDGGTLIVAARQEQTVLDVRTGRCGPPGDPIDEVPWGEIRARRLHVAFLALGAAEKNSLEDRAYDESVADLVKACATGERRCIDQAWPRAPSVLERLADHARQAVHGYHVGEVAVLLLGMFLVMGQAIRRWLGISSAKR